MSEQREERQEKMCGQRAENVLDIKIDKTKDAKSLWTPEGTNTEASHLKFYSSLITCAA